MNGRLWRSNGCGCGLKPWFPLREMDETRPRDGRIRHPLNLGEDSTGMAGLLASGLMMAKVRSDISQRVHQGSGLRLGGLGVWPRPVPF